MTTLLDAPKGPSPAKVEEFVEKQLSAARRRVRLLDFFMTGLTLGIGSLVFFLVVQLLDRKFETPRGAIWGVVGAYLAFAAAFVYLNLFRGQRRQINPYFAARRVERTVPNAKNSLVTWVDFEEDGQLPGSIRTAISQKAYRDIKGVDLNRAIENRKILWLAIVGGVMLLANLVVAFLPPTRTELTLELPKGGDATVFSNQDVAFGVRVHGRIPSPTDPDAVRLRLWYNPEDPESYEDRPMRPAEDDRRQFALTVPAKQVRTGFQYRILAGNTQTAEHTITAKILPEFRDFEISYEFPAYLKQAPEKTNEPNLLAPYGSKATVIVATTREVKQGYIQFEGQPQTLDGQLIDGRPDAIKFEFPIEKQGTYQVFFTTPEGDKNSDPARFKITVVDLKPVIRSFDLDYDYPAYLRFKPVKVAEVREPEIEAPKGTKVMLTARTNRAVKEAKLELPGLPPIAGELLPDQPMWVRFKLPALMEETTARATFTPSGNEAPSRTRDVPIRVFSDQLPIVQITEPAPQEVSLPPTGTLELKGIATDDHGVDKLTLRFRLNDTDLMPKPYRGGMSFLRKEDNSWPTRVDYKDVVKLPELRREKDPTWRVKPGMRIEYWLDAEDNRTLPEPKIGESKPHKYIVVTEPPKPPEQKEIDDKTKRAEQAQKEHEKKQDQGNQAEKRDVKQDPPKGADKPPEGDPMRMGDPMPGGMGDPMPGGMNPPMPGGMNPPMPGGMNPMGMGDPPPDVPPDHADKTKQIEKALRNANNPNPAEAKPDTRPMDDAKVDPGAARPEPKDPMGPPPAEDRTPNTDPNKPMMGEGAAGQPKKGEIDQKPGEKGDRKPAENMGGMKPDAGQEKPSFGNAGGGDSTQKPDARKPDPKMPPGTDPKSTEKAEPKPDKSADPMGGTKSGEPKPEKDVTPSESKPGEAGPKGAEKPPEGAGETKPLSRPNPGATRGPPKKDDPGAGGETRPKPMGQDMTGEQRPGPMGGMPGMNDEPAGGAKGGPSKPPENGGEQGELERELGELDREINSTNPKVDERKQATADQLMRNPKTREKTREKLEELERNAKDPLTRQKAKQARESGEKAAKEYDAEKPNQENVDQLSKKLNSKDEKERRDAEQRIKDWEKDQQNKKDLAEQTEQLKKKDRSAGERVENETKKAEQARGDQPNDQQMSQLAKDLKSDDSKTREKAEQQLKDMAKDPKTAKQAQDQLNNLADKSQNPGDKKDLKDAADQMAKAGQAGQKPKVDPKDLKDAADKLASGDPKAQQEAKDKLEQMMKDPAKREQAKDMLDKMANDAKTPDEKQKFDDAKKAADQMAQKHEPKVDPKDLDKMAKDMAGKDPQAKKDAQEKFDKIANDPKARERAMEQLKDMAKNAKDEDVKKAMQEMMKQGNDSAKKDPPKPADLEKLAKDFDKLDEQTKKDLAEKMDKAMKDPDLKKQMKDKADDMAKKMSPEEKAKFDQMLKNLGGNFPDLGGKPDPADPRHKLKAAELVLEDLKKLKADDEARRKLGWTPEQLDRWEADQKKVIDTLRSQANKGDYRDPSTAKSPVRSGPEGVKLDERKGNDPLRGGRYAPPAGYLDPFKQFTQDATKGGK